MVRYLVTIKNNRIVDVKCLDDDEEEYLGIEWALSEVMDSYRYNRSADGSYSLAGEEEVAEFLDQIRTLLGADALGTFANSIQ